MLHIPEITPVRVKANVIPQALIDPGSMGYYFPQEVGPRVVYLDERYHYPPQNTWDDPRAEKARQSSIWETFRGDTNSVQFLDRMAEESAATTLPGIKANVFEQLGHRDSAEYFERVFSQVFGESMNVVIISTGIRPFDGHNYHDIGYLR